MPRYEKSVSPKTAMYGRRMERPRYCRGGRCSSDIEEARSFHSYSGRNHIKESARRLAEAGLWNYSDSKDIFDALVYNDLGCTDGNCDGRRFVDVADRIVDESNGDARRAERLLDDDGFLDTLQSLVREHDRNLARVSSSRRMRKR